MGLTYRTLIPVLLLCLALYCTPVAAFGAGNIASISKVEGQNWRHGDLEDTLLQLFLAAGASGGRRRKFSSMDVKRIYFGNWLRDYSQAIDTGALKYVEAETVRILLWALSFMAFGYATGEFEVTAERLGCYRPEEHIDNPKDYNDNNDARDVHPSLRGPVDEELELGIDLKTGLKNYIANENIRRLSNGDEMNTSAKLLRSLFTRSIELGRRYTRSGREEDLFEAFRLMGTGLHCIEDFSAHSNYTELALIELGEYGVFPHVGANTMVNIQGRDIWPLVTGTFGGVDFLHSVLGEVNDKALQSEISQLEHTISEAERTAQNDDEQSIIRDLMSKLNIGGKDDIDSKTSQLKQKSDAQKQATESGEPFGLSQNARQLGKDIYPFLEFHDELMRSINAALESVGLDIVMEKLAEAVSVFVFCLLAPYILPVIKQASAELKTGSSEVIASSEAQQHVVFDDDNSSNPTHSMLSKDHFTNLLNEPAGMVASAVLKFAVPLLMNAWDDEGINPNQVCDEIIGGVFHHPAFRNGEDGRPGFEGRRVMFAVVEEWWNTKDSRQQDELRRNLSREGVEQGYNHKAGAHDSGHGCGAPIHRKKPKNRGGDIGGAVGESVGMALKNALGGGKEGGDAGLGGMLGSMLGGAISQRLGESGGGGGGESREGSYEQAEPYGAERLSYSTRESYETPEYSRTTERYGGSGREPEEKKRYESRRENTYDYGDQPSYDYQRGGQDTYQQPQHSYRQQEEREQPQYYYGGDDGRRSDQQYSYDGEQQGYYGGGDEGSYGRRGTEKYSSPSHSHPPHSGGYGHGSSDVFYEKGEKKKKDKKKKKGVDEEDEEEEDGKKYKEKKEKKKKKGKKYGGEDYEEEDEDEDEDEDEEEEYGKKKKEKKEKKKKFRDEDGDGEDDDEEWGKKKKKEKKEKKYDDDEDDDEEWRTKKKEKKYKEHSGGEEDKKKKEKKDRYKEKKYGGSEDEDEDDDYKKKKEKKKYKH